MKIMSVVNLILSFLIICAGSALAQETIEQQAGDFISRFLPSQGRVLVSIDKDNSELWHEEIKQATVGMDLAPAKILLEEETFVLNTKNRKYSFTTQGNVSFDILDVLVRTCRVPDEDSDLKYIAWQLELTCINDEKCVKRDRGYLEAHFLFFESPSTGSSNRSGHSKKPRLRLWYSHAFKSVEV